MGGGVDPDRFITGQDESPTSLQQAAVGSGVAAHEAGADGESRWN